MRSLKDRQPLLYIDHGTLTTNSKGTWHTAPETPPEPIPIAATQTLITGPNVSFDGKTLVALANARTPHILLSPKGIISIGAMSPLRDISRKPFQAQIDCAASQTGRLRLPRTRGDRRLISARLRLRGRVCPALAGIEAERVLEGRSFRRLPRTRGDRSQPMRSVCPALAGIEEGCSFDLQVAPRLPRTRGDRRGEPLRRRWHNGLPRTRGDRSVGDSPRNGVI